MIGKVPFKHIFISRNTIEIRVFCKTTNKKIKLYLKTNQEKEIKT